MVQYKPSYRPAVVAGWILTRARSYYAGSLWHRAIIILAIFITVCVGGMYGIARWYIYSQRQQPVIWGVSFVPDYARSLGVDPRQTMDALIGDMHVRYFRLTSYWSDIEPSPGHYDFSQLDWEFQKADAVPGTRVMLTVGLRQPRWPECHAPSWVNTSLPDSQWQPQLEAFMTKVIERYRHNPALQSYQLENEYFLRGFGTCTNFDRQRLVSEYALLKRLDPHHPVIVGRSNNAIGFPLGAPVPDAYGISIYKRIWSPLTRHYLEYPFPAWYYGFLAGIQQLLSGRNMIIDELQAEPWTPHSLTIPQTSLSEQNKSFNAVRLQNRFRYARATGMRTIYMWGSEYWYYRKVVLRDPSVWDVARQHFRSLPY